MKKFDKEIVSGSILRSIWKLTWPVTLLNLVNGLHGLIDHALVGWHFGQDGNAANAGIGSAWQCFLVFVVFIASLFHGMNVLIARYAGKEDRDMLSKVAYNAFLTSLYILVGIVAPVGYFIAPWILELVGLKPEVMVYALPYIRVLFTCSAPLFLMFMLVGAFQASGDTKTPLVLGIFSTILNLVLSATLIVGFGPIPSIGPLGAAVGTVVAPIPAVLIALYIIFHKKTIIHPPEKFTLIPDFTIMKRVATIGLPTGVQGVLLNLGGVLLIRFINQVDYASATLAAYTICYSQLFSFITWPSFGLRSACATVMGQNIGAGNHGRGKHAVYLGALIGFSWAFVIGLAFWFIPVKLMGMFKVEDPIVLSYATSLLHFLAFSGLVLAPALAFTGALQGAGETKKPMYIAFATQIVLLLGMCWYFNSKDMLTPDRIWLSILTSHIARLALTYGVFRTAGWMHTKVEFEDEVQSGDEKVVAEE